MGKGILAAFLGALAMFVWGFVSWKFVKLMPQESFSNSATIAESMRASSDEDGVYFVPLMPDTTDKESSEHKSWSKEFSRGPRAMVIYNTGEFDPDKFMYTAMLKGFLVMLASCLLAAIMLGNAKIGPYMGRVIFCVTFGAIIAVYSNGSQWAWFYAPLGWTIPAIINDIVAWACAGLVMGAMIKPR